MPESYKENGRPAQQWYWDDWFSSHDVHSCSLAAQGLWINLLGIMFTSEVRGTLAINGIQMDNKAIAKRFSKNITTIDKLVMELEEARVFSRFPDGTIYSRRMCRQSKKKRKISKIRSKAGKEGMKKRWGESDKKSDNKKITKITASPPSPSSSPPSLNIYTPQFNKFWKEYPKKKEKDVAFGAFKNLKKEEQQQIVIATRNYRIEIEREKQEKKFIKHPATFIRKNRWKDYLGSREKEEMQTMDERHEKAMEERK